MKRTAASLFSTQEAVGYYFEYLRHSSKDLPVLRSLLPGAGDPADRVVAFHSALCSAASSHGLNFCGIKVLPECSTVVKEFRGTETICVPVFSSFFDRDAYIKKDDRIQFVEAGVCFRLSARNSAAATKALTAESVMPFLELTGTRFPFYPPSLNSFACDVGGCVGLIVGNSGEDPSQVTTPLVERQRFVMTHDDEPVAVGALNMSAHSGNDLIDIASRYAESIGSPLLPGHFVLCGGCSPRLPAMEGTYRVNWGTLGSVKCSIS